MSLLDNMTSAINRGASAAQRTGKTAQLKLQLSDLMKQRRDLMAQLGASLYEDVKDNDELRDGREPLFDSIINIDAQRASIEAEIAEIEAKANEARTAQANAISCPRCGSSIGGSDLFCSGCGMPAEEARAAVQPPAQHVEASTSGLACPSCGAAIETGDSFCMSCGAPIIERDHSEELDNAEDAEHIEEAL